MESLKHSATTTGASGSPRAAARAERAARQAAEQAAAERTATTPATTPVPTAPVVPVTAPTPVAHTVSAARTQSLPIQALVTPATEIPAAFSRRSLREAEQKGKPAGRVKNVSKKPVLATAATGKSPRRRIAAAASIASVGLVGSLLLAAPANAASLTPAVPAVSAIAADKGNTQSLAVAEGVSSALAQRDSYSASITGAAAATIALNVSGVSDQTISDNITEEGGGTAASSTEAAGKKAIADALAVGGSRATIVQTALQYLGDPYVLGGASHSGIDCSGLVLVAYNSVGISLAHSVSAQDSAGTTISADEAKPGDLVVFDDDEHVGIYLGDGMVIHAPDYGRTVSIEGVWTGEGIHYVRILPS